MHLVLWRNSLNYFLQDWELLTHPYPLQLTILIVDKALVRTLFCKSEEIFVHITYLMKDQSEFFLYLPVANTEFDTRL